MKALSIVFILVLGFATVAALWHATEFTRKPELDTLQPIDTSLPQKKIHGEESAFTFLLASEYKSFIQKLESPDKKEWFALFMDYAGFDDPAWYLYRLPHTTDVERVKLGRGDGDRRIVLWNYSEGGDQTAAPTIQLIHNRYIVFSRGGLHHSLYDVHEDQVLVNDMSPFHSHLDSEEYKILEPRPSIAETKRMIKEWKVKNLHNPIRKIIGEDSNNH